MNQSLVWDYFGMYKNGPEYDKRFTICLLCGAWLDYTPDKSTSCQHKLEPPSNWVTTCMHIQLLPAEHKHDMKMKENVMENDNE